MCELSAIICQFNSKMPLDTTKEEGTKKTDPTATTEKKTPQPQEKPDMSEYTYKSVPSGIGKGKFPTGNPPKTT